MIRQRFITERRARWRRLEELLNHLEKRGARHAEEASLDEFVALYRTACSDLAKARTEAMGEDGGEVKLYERLITPLIDLGTALTVTLEFDHWFRWDPDNLDEQGVLDVRSSLTGGQWVNVSTWQGASSENPDHQSIDLTAQAAGASDLDVRWSTTGFEEPVGPGL